ncbi:MAG TPA: hypothetical protein VK468_07300 [Pyrinomonadaceae bacterium]|nr:hypothetical protein [Pyrinomonadaceae bacterium]
MKRILFLGALCLAFCIAAFAQAKTADYSGTWTLDVSKSKLDERARIESMTMTVTQTAKDIKIDSKTTRAPRPDGAAGGTGGGGGFGRGGGFGSGDSSTTYTLDGKETKIEQESAMGKVPVTLTAKVEGGVLNLASARTFNGPNGVVTAATKETWTLSADAKTLTVVRENQTPRGSFSSTLVFAKK